MTMTTMTTSISINHSSSWWWWKKAEAEAISNTHNWGSLMSRISFYYTVSDEISVQKHLGETGVQGGSKEKTSCQQESFSFLSRLLITAVSYPKESWANGIDIFEHLETSTYSKLSHVDRKYSSFRTKFTGIWSYSSWCTSCVGRYVGIMHVALNVENADNVIMISYHYTIIAKSSVIPFDDNLEVKGLLWV